MSVQTALLNANKERLLNAKKQRQIQLEKWENYEKERNKTVSNTFSESHKTQIRNIQFSKEITLLEAVSRNDIKEVTEFLNQGANPDSATVDGLTGLHQCSIDDFYDMASLLLKYNASVNAVDSEMWTPLHAAATCGNSQMCLLLIKFGADFLAINADGNMPYDICENTDILGIIESEMARHNITQEQIDAARGAPEEEMLQHVKECIYSRQDLDEKDSQGASLLHIACSLGYIEIVKCLLEARAHHSLPDKDGWLPIHIASCWNYLEIVETLVSYGADIDATSSKGETVFDVCDPPSKDKLLQIKNNVANIRKNFDFNHLSQNKSFRKNRGSSIRRTSVRQKNMLSRKEAREEFVTMNQPIVRKSDEKGDAINETANDEENSDVDNSVPKEVTHLPKDEIMTNIKPVSNKNKSEKSTEMNQINNSSHNSDIKSSKSTPAPDVPQTQLKVPPRGVKINSHDALAAQNESQESYDVQLKDPKEQQQTDPKIEVDALNKPRRVFSSTSENWSTNDFKKPRRKKCEIL